VNASVDVARRMETGTLFQCHGSNRRQVCHLVTLPLTPLMSLKHTWMSSGFTSYLSPFSTFSFMSTTRHETCRQCHGHSTLTRCVMWNATTR